MSDELKTVIKVGMNSTDVTGSVSDINRQLRILDSEFTKAAEQAKALGDAAGELSAKQSQLTQKIELQSEKVKKLKDDYEKTRTEKGENAKATANLAVKYNQAEAALSKMQAQLNDTNKEIDKQNSILGKLPESISALNTKLDILKAEYAGASSEGEKLSGSTVKLQGKAESLNNQLKLQTEKVSLLSKAFEELTSSAVKDENAIDKLKLELVEAKNEMNKMGNELKSTTDKIDASGTAMGKFSQRISDFKQKSEDVGVRLDRVGQACTAVGLAFTALGVGSGKAFIDFENQFKMTSTLIDQNIMSWDKARKGILKISDDSGKAAGDLALALYDALSSGVETGDSLQFLKESTDLARAGFTDASTSVDILTTILNSYGLSVDEVTKISDRLILTQDAGKITVGQLGSDFGRVAGIAAQAKVPLNDLFAAIATLTKNGVGASESVTQLRSILSAVVKPTSEAHEEARRLGIQFNVNALATKGLAGFLNEVQLRTHGNTEAFAKLFGNVEGLNGSLILTGKGAKDFNEILGQMDNSTGRASEAINNLEQSAGEKFNISLNKMKNSLIEIGGALSPVINALAVLFTLLSKIPAPVLTFLAVLGPVLLIVGRIISLIETVQNISKAGKVIGAAEKVSKGMSFMNSTLAKVIVIVLGVAMAITILVLALGALTGKSDDFTRSMQTVSNFKMPSVDTSQYTTPSNGYPGFAVGINRVPHDMTAVIHEDEAVIPAKYNPFNPDADMPLNGSTSGETYIFQPGSIVIDAKSVKDFSSVVSAVKKQQQTLRAGKVTG